MLLLMQCSVISDSTHPANNYDVYYSSRIVPMDNNSRVWLIAWYFAEVERSCWICCCYSAQRLISRRLRFYVILTKCFCICVSY